MTKTPVRLYLDVDGVLNFFGARAGSAINHPWGDTMSGEAGLKGYIINWAPALLEALTELDVEIVWLTTWRDHAVEHLAPLFGGWGSDFRVLHPRREDEWMYQRVASLNWKAKAIVEDVNNDPAHFIWIDDELWAMKRTMMDHDLEHSTEVQNLIVIPEPNFGITPDDVDRMKAFIAEVRAND